MTIFSKNKNILNSKMITRKNVSEYNIHELTIKANLTPRSGALRKVKQLFTMFVFFFSGYVAAGVRYIYK